MISAALAKTPGQHRLPEAADAWRELIALAPDQAESYNHLALELADLGLFAEALYCHDRAMALQPDSPAFHCGRGPDARHRRSLRRGLFALCGGQCPGTPDLVAER